MPSAADAVTGSGTMNAASAAAPRVLHALPGRLRLHLPGWDGSRPEWIEERLRAVGGVQEVRANPLTRNVLVRFDAAVTDAGRLEAEVEAVPQASGGATRPAHVPPPITDTVGQRRRARIPVRGLEYSPDVGARIVRRLASFPGVQASANPLTGRVLVLLDEHAPPLDELVAEVRALEGPADGEGWPAHPLDTRRATHALAGVTGAVLGLGVLGALALAGSRRSRPGAARTAGILTLLQTVPALHHALRSLLGPDRADIAVALPRMLLLTVANSPIGLLAAGVEAAMHVTALREQRRAWERHEAATDGLAVAPGATLRPRSGERAPLPARILEGVGTATGRDGMPLPAVPGERIPAGSALRGGPFLVELEGWPGFTAAPRPASPSLSVDDVYRRWSGTSALVVAGAVALWTRSWERGLVAVLILSPRVAVIVGSASAAEAGARTTRSGATVVGTRPERTLRLPDLLVLDSPRLLADGLEFRAAVPLRDGLAPEEVAARAASVAAAAGSPWGNVFRGVETMAAEGGGFDGRVATARVHDEWCSLRPADDAAIPPSLRLEHRGHFLLLLTAGAEPLGLVVLRPRLAAGASELAAAARARGVRLVLLAAGSPVAAQVLAARSEIPVEQADALEVIRTHQEQGGRVAFVSDSAEAGAAFAAADLAVAVTGRSATFHARADILVPELGTLVAVLDAAGRHERTVRDATAISLLTNVIGTVRFVRGSATTLPGATKPMTMATLATLSLAWWRLRGGEAPRAGGGPRFIDPQPERWAREELDAVFQAFGTSAAGLGSAEAAARRRERSAGPQSHPFADALGANVRSPLTAFVAGAAGLALLSGAVADAAVITATLIVNLAGGTWQEYSVGEVARSLEELDAATARVLRDGRPTRTPAAEVVPGDILLLAHGDRVAADARVIAADGLEVDEAALTGESLPVAKSPDGESDESRILLEGSDIVVGHGAAVVVAVGEATRMGAMAAALAAQPGTDGPLGARLGALFRQLLPVTVAGGAVVTVAGLLRGQPLVPQLVLGASTSLAALPEALPILAAMGQAAAARRLAHHGARVRRPAAVEALGRVDVACVDKTGTLTEGRLAVHVVATRDEEWDVVPGTAPVDARRILLAGALASPHPDALDAAAHSTDAAIIRAAEAAGLGVELRQVRRAEARFASTRPYHAARVGKAVLAKGAPEVLIECCTRQRTPRGVRALGRAGRAVWQERARALAERGLRVLLVAEGPSATPVDEPRGLTAIGFIGIRDPLRAGVHEALRRCTDAGIRVIMLTGDHSDTARAIARDAGLLADGNGALLTGAEMLRLGNGELDARLEGVAVIARATPLDKLRIIEGLRRRGHTIAMTGDGINDAPALRLADVGVAMGRGGTDVARQAADLVLTDDDFADLANALVEGRSLWRNLRRSLGLLLGGNLGELAYIAGGAVLGVGASLTVRQILATNLITDFLPASAVAVQPPEHRQLAGLDREGEAALGGPLRREIGRRAAATAVPALASFLAMRGAGSLPDARTVGFASIIATQLALTLDPGRAQGNLTPPVVAAVGASGGALLALLTVPPLRGLFGLTLPGPLGWTLIGASAAAAVAASRLLGNGAAPARTPPAAAGTRVRSTALPAPSPA